VNSLNDNEVDRLLHLFYLIKVSLESAGPIGVDFPTRTNRLAAVENMKEVLEIHNYTVIYTGNELEKDIKAMKKILEIRQN